MSQSATMKFQTRKTTDWIVIHCAASDEQDFSAKDIDKWHRQRGFLCIGYQFVIRRSGEVETGRPVNVVGAHVQGYNHNSIGICMIGGGSKKETNNFTDSQWESLEKLSRSLKHEYPSVHILGHRDFPAVAKWCPSFSVADWLKRVGIENSGVSPKA